MDLVVEHLSKTFSDAGRRLWGPASAVRAAHDLSFTVNAGQSLGIVGESGSGKTTVAKMLAGFLPADAGRATMGESDLLVLKRRDRARLVQMVFQDPLASLNPKLLLGAQLKEALGSDRESEASELMGSVGLTPEHLERYPHQLSGGQRQRFAIARSLAKRPSLLLADEPVSSLDLSVQAQIINLLNRLRAERGFSQIVISHDLAVIANTCDHVLVLRQGEAVESGAVSEILNRPSHPYTQRLLAASPVIA